MKILKAKIDGTLYIYDEGTREETEAKIRKVVLTGEMAYYPNRLEWIDDVIVTDMTQSASAMFQWNATGTKVKHVRYYCVQDLTTKEITRTKLRTIYKSL